MFRLTAILGTAAILLSGCMETQAVSTAPAKAIGVDVVKVELAENASYGLLQASQDPQLAKTFAATLSQELSQDLITGGSGNMATVIVEAVTIQSGASRTVAAAESSVRGDVVVSNAAGQEIYRVEDVRFANAAKRNQSTINGLPIGALISMASNSADASPEQQIVKLADGYATTIAARLGR